MNENDIEINAVETDLDADLEAVLGTGLESELEVGVGREQVVVNGATVDAGETYSRVLIAPWGQVHSSNGDFVLDRQAAEMVVQAFEAHGTDLPIDYEHQSLGGKYSSPNGQAPAAGWIRSLEVEYPKNMATNVQVNMESDGVPEPGLYAQVEWTAAAQAKVAAKEYRYLSPVVIVRKRDRRMVALHSAALTNKPAIVGMRPIVNSLGRDVATGATAETPAETVTEASADACEIVETREVVTNTREQGMDDEAMMVLRTRLGVEESMEDSAVLVAAEQRIAELEDAMKRHAAEGRIQEAVRTGKLVAAQREWAMTLALRDSSAFEEWLATAPVVVVPGKTQPPTNGNGSKQRSVVVASAKNIFRAEPNLALLTSEEAWVGQALREARITQE